MSLKTGETVILNTGERGTVKFSACFSEYLTVEINGETRRVSKNDLFGMNNNVSSEHLDNQLSFEQKWFDHYQKKIAENKEIVKINSESIKNYSYQLESILSAFGVKSYKDITDPSFSKTAKWFVDCLSGLRKSTRYAKNQIYYCANRAFDFALDMGETKNMIALFKKVVTGN